MRITAAGIVDCKDRRFFLHFLSPSALPQKHATRSSCKDRRSPCTSCHSGWAPSPCHRHPGPVTRYETCTCTCAHAHAHAHVHVHMHMCTCTCTCNMHMHMSCACATCACACAFACACACACVCACGPSHIDLLQVGAISGGSRPAFRPVGRNNGTQGQRRRRSFARMPAHPKVTKDPGTRAPWVRPPSPPAAPHRDRGRPM